MVCNLLSVDGSYDPDVVALNAASASLASSDIPWAGPVGAVTVGWCSRNSRPLVSPSRREMSDSRLNLLVAGDAEGRALMLEAEADNLERAMFLDAVQAGLEGCAGIAKAIGELYKDVVKRELPPALGEQQDLVDLRHEINLLCRQKVRAIFCDGTHDKISRDRAVFELRDSAVESLLQGGGKDGLGPAHVNECFSQMVKEVMADLVLDEGRRVDGRTRDQLRPISCETDLHAPLHGSALFQRGQTQVMCTVSLDSLESALKSDPVSVLTGAVKEKNFFLHYEFPPYATNDIGRPGGGAAGRREMGHGALAEKALRAAIPKEYPFTIRLTSEVLESNGNNCCIGLESDHTKVPLMLTLPLTTF